MTTLKKREELQKQAEIGKLTGKGLWAGLKLTWDEMTDAGREQELSKLAATIFGRKGGRSKSPAKQAASRRNGRKGGRPRRDKI